MTDSAGVTARALRTTTVALPRRFLRPCLLLLLAEGTSHGYELLEQVHALGLGSTDAAGVYRCLRAMDEEGLVRSAWEPSTLGPARRTYVLTEEGRERLAEIVTELASTAEALHRFLDRFSGLAGEEVCSR